MLFFETFVTMERQGQWPALICISNVRSPAGSDRERGGGEGSGPRERSHSLSRWAAPRPLSDRAAQWQTMDLYSSMKW